MPVVASVDGPIIRPAWLSATAAEIWDRKVQVYESRGQHIHGCEDTLAQYCALEAKLVAAWRRGRQPATKTITAHRVYANEFFDTPASQEGHVRRPKAANPFSALGSDPAAAGV